MTFELTPERLQDIAVGCVTKFIQKQASLSEAIAKEAMDLELNADQTKRVIEASNTIAYLRQLEKSADRTFEFEVGDYNKVMAYMTMPDDMMKKAQGDDADEDDKEHDGDGEGRAQGENGDQKEADKSETEQDADKLDKKDEDSAKDPANANGNQDPKNDSKDDDDDEDDKEHDGGDDQEKKAMLMKGYFSAKETLEKMAYEEAAICIELDQAARTLGRDVHALEKLSFVVEPADLSKAIRLCNLEKRATEENFVFTNKELAAANHLYGLYKKACDFAAKKNEIEDFVKRAEKFLFKQPADVEKQAGLGSKILEGIEGIGNAMGSVVSRSASAVGKGIGNAATGGYKFSRAASAAGMSTGDAVKDFDKIRKTQGAAAAAAKYNGAKPGLLTQRIGLAGIGTAAAGWGMTHKNNVKDI